VELCILRCNLIPLSFYDDGSNGYFVQPTVILTKVLYSITMRRRYCPVVTVRSAVPSASHGMERLMVTV